MGANGSACESSIRPSRAISRVAPKELARAVRAMSGTAPYCCKERVEMHPLGRALSQQGLQPVARLLDGPDGAPGHDMHALDGLLALVRVRLEEVEDHRRVLAHADGAHALRLPAGEHVAAEPVAGHELAGGVAHGLQPHQAERQAGGQLLAARLVLRALLARQQQPRLEEGEPGGHHQVVGGERQPELQRALDELQVLLGQRQHRDLGEVHLLRARERQQEVERAFETLQIDDQGLVRAGQIGRIVPALEFGLVLPIPCDHGSTSSRAHRG